MQKKTKPKRGHSNMADIERIICTVWKLTNERKRLTTVVALVLPKHARARFDSHMGRPRDECVCDR